MLVALLQPPPAMAFDPTTLTAALFVQLGVLALVLPLMADGRGHKALRWGGAALAAQALAWGGLLWPEAVPGSVGMAGVDALSVAAWILALQAVQCWLGPRWGLPWLWALPAVAFVAHLAAPSPPWRAAGAALLPALVQGGLLLALWMPATLNAAAGHRRWRLTLSLPLALLALLNVVRGFMALDPSVDLPTLRGAHPVALGAAVLSGAAAATWALACLSAWRAETEAQWQAAAPADALTGLANRTALEARGAELLAHARRHGDTLGALSIEIDHLQQIQDRQGLEVGNACRVLLAECLQALARPGDAVARLGDEGFVVLRGRTRADGAQAFDRRLREALQAQAPERLGFFLDVSAGWSLLRPDDRQVDDLLQRADAGRQRAKAEGRGRLAAEPGLDAEADA
ncbi:MAG: diguanylate cyclase domain-containing protein [Inhella sp.]